MLKGTPFQWWRANGDGTATPHDDTPIIRARIDIGERHWYGTIEGAIIHGGVLATAYTRKTEETYDAAHWLRTGKLVSKGAVTITKITAQPTQPF
jgi:hypothetical protein